MSVQTTERKRIERLLSPVSAELSPTHEFILSVIDPNQVPNEFFSILSYIPEGLLIAERQRLVYDQAHALNVRPDGLNRIGIPKRYDVFRPEPDAAYLKSRGSTVRYLGINREAKGGQLLEDLFYIWMGLEYLDGYSEVIPYGKNKIRDLINTACQLPYVREYLQNLIDQTDNVQSEKEQIVRYLLSLYGVDLSDNTMLGQLQESLTAAEEHLYMAANKGKRILILINKSKLPNKTPLLQSNYPIHPDALDEIPVVGD